MTQVLESKDLHLRTFERVERDLPGRGLPWLSSLRRREVARFEALGFPTQKDEEWRFTSAAPIAETSFILADKTESVQFETLRGLALCPLGFYRLVFVNGRHRPELSLAPELPGGAKMTTLARALKSEPGLLEAHLGGKAAPQGGAFAALNAAFFNDGAFLYLPKGFVLDKPLHLIFVSSAPAVATMSHSRILIVAEPNSKAAVIEEYVSLERGVSFTNVVTEALVGENAGLEHYKLQRETDRALHVSALEVRQERDSRFVSHSVSLGGALVRNDVHAALDGEGADCALNGLYVVRGRSHLDNQTVIEHLRPHGTSRELYKGVLDGHARAVFGGTIVVRPNAQKTDARVYNKNLLLSDDGLVNTKPEFKIYANDVQCRHGATIGQLSADALFYLRSRGLDAEEARRILVHAFASEMVERVEIATLKTALAESLNARLPETLE